MKGPPELVQKNADMEPYRTRLAADSSAHMPGVDSRAQELERGNVFRDQISRSQRQRATNPGDEDGGGGVGVGNPYVTTVDGSRYMSPRQQQRDDDWSATATSSEDEVDRRAAEGVGVAQAFEMQRPAFVGGGKDPAGPVVGVGTGIGGIRHTPPSARLGAGGGGGVADLGQQDTAYRSQSQSQIRNQTTGNNAAAGVVAAASPTHPGQRGPA